MSADHTHSQFQDRSVSLLSHTSSYLHPTSTTAIALVSVEKYTSPLFSRPSDMSESRNFTFPKTLRRFVCITPPDDQPYVPVHAEEVSPLCPSEAGPSRLACASGLFEQAALDFVEFSSRRWNALKRRMVEPTKEAWNDSKAFTAQPTQISRPAPLSRRPSRTSPAAPISDSSMRQTCTPASISRRSQACALDPTPPHPTSRDAHNASGERTMANFQFPFALISLEEARVRPEIARRGVARR